MALRDINMIPPEMAARRFLIRHLGFWAWSLVLLLALIYSLYYYQMNHVLSKHMKLMKGQSMDARLVERIEEINRARDSIRALRHEFAALDNITNRQLYYRIMGHLSDMFNGFSWLKQLEIEQGDAEQAKIQLTGFSVSNRRLGDFLSRFSDSPHFEDVVLKRTEKTLPGESLWSQPVIRFTITCTFSGGRG